MGLMTYTVRFPGGLPPTEEEFRRELAALAGSLAALEEYEVRGDTAVVTTMMQPVLGPYAIKLLVERGGQYVSSIDGQPLPTSLPSFTHKPWRAWPWYTRLSIHMGFHAALLRPPQR
jgi:hypothetical protein